MITIKIAKEFSTTPGGRFKKTGPHSGEAFREKILEALKQNDIVTIILDGTEGYGSSFLEEAFGGLVRDKTFSPDQILSRVRIVSETPQYATYEKEAYFYLEDAAKHSSY